MTLKPIDAAIAAAEAKVRELTHDLRQQKRALKKLYEARALDAGEELRPEARPPRLPDRVERLLRERGELYVDEIVEALRAEGIEANRQTLSSMFVRYIARGKRFRRVGANKFELAEE